jgi:hypothetical protein
MFFLDLPSLITICLLFNLMTQSNIAAQAQELSYLEQLRATTHSVLDGISGDVGKKKSTLDKTVNCDS